MKNAGWRKRVIARYYERVMRRHEGFMAERKQRLFQDLPAHILEIGPGAGANLPYLPRDCQYIGVEPNPYMRALLGDKIRGFCSRYSIRDGRAEELPVEDESVDAVIATLTLCSVTRPHVALGEIRRVLKSNGRLYFLEHVAAKTGSWLRSWQRLVCPLWRIAADGCHVYRDTEQTITQAGLSIEWIERIDVPFRVAGPFVSPHIFGVARKASA